MEHSPQLHAGGGARLLHGLIGYDLADIVKHSNLSQDVTQQTLETLLKAGRVKRIGLALVRAASVGALADEAIRLLREQHRQYPLRSGLSKEEWRTRLHLSAKMATEVFAALHAEGLLEFATAKPARQVASFDYLVYTNIYYGATATCRATTAQILPESLHTTRLCRGGKHCWSRRLESLIEQGQLVKLSDGVLFLRETHDEAVAKLVAFLRSTAR